MATLQQIEQVSEELPALVWLDPSLSHHELENRLVSVLASARRHSSRLDEYGELWKDELDPFVSLGDKVVVETALLAFIAARTNRPRVVAVAQELADTLAPYARSTRNRSLLLRFPHTACSLGAAHIALTSAGSIDPGFDQLLGTCFTSGHAEALERLPYRAMEMRWLRGLYHGERADFADLLGASILSTVAHPVHMSSAEAYALTHALMYLSDFGRDPLPHGVDAQRCAEMLDASIAWHLVGENFDLLAECLLGASFTRQPWTPYARLGWRVLSRAWDRLGFLPCPSFDPNEYAELRNDQARAYAFRHTYHTMHVAGMLCAVLLQRPTVGPGAAAPLSRVPLPQRGLAERCLGAARRSEDHRHGGRRRRQSASFSRGQLETVDPLTVVADRLSAASPDSDALWRHTLADCPLDDAELASILLDGLLIHAAREYQLATLAATILDAEQLQLPVTPTLVEAVEFLLRQQLPTGAIGAHLIDGDNISAADAFTDLARLLEAALTSTSGRLDPDGGIP